MLEIIKKITIIFAVIVSFFISGEPYNVTAEVNGEVTSETQIISVTVKNDTGKIIDLVAPVVKSIERKTDGEWENVGFVWIPEGDWRDTLCYPKQEITKEISLSSYEISSLAPGEYRLEIPYDVKIKEETIFTNAYAYFTVDE